MLFIALESISSFKTDNKNAPPEDEISSETKRIDILLKIGLAMILISGILFATSSWETIPDIVKVLGILLIGGIFLGLSKFSEEKLNIKKTTKNAIALRNFSKVNKTKFYVLWKKLLENFSTFQNSVKNEGKKTLDKNINGTKDGKIIKKTIKSERTPDHEDCLF